MSNKLDELVSLYGVVQVYLNALRLMWILWVLKIRDLDGEHSNEKKNRH